MGKTSALFILLSLWLAFTRTDAVLKTTHLEDLCLRKRTSVIDLRKEYSGTGILMASPPMQSGNEFDCEVQILPGIGRSIVLSIHKYNILHGDEVTIEDFDSYKIALIGSGFFPSEKKSLISEGKITIRYMRGNNTYVKSRPGFQFTFTHLNDGPCFENEFACKNGKCILKRYSCDGHNHCGDLSDQKKCSPEDESQSNLDNTVVSTDHQPFLIWFIIAASVCTLIIIVVVIVAVVVTIKPRNRKSGTSSTKDSGTGTNNGDLALHVPQDGGTNPVAPVPSAPERESLFDRVRRSFRGKQNVRPEEMARQQRQSAETYEVPSMYPSLDHVPTAPDVYGVENPDFKIEE